MCGTHGIGSGGPAATLQSCAGVAASVLPPALTASVRDEIVQPLYYSRTQESCLEGTPTSSTAVDL